MARPARPPEERRDPVVDALDAIERPEGDRPGGAAARLPAEQRLARWFRDHPRFGRRDRTRIADGVFHLLRHRRLYAALARHRAGVEASALAAATGAPPGRTGAVGAAELAAAARSVGTLGDVLADPGSIDVDRLIGAVEAETGPLAPPLRYSLPDWLWARFEAEYGPDRAATIARALLDAAPTDIRVNLLKSKVGPVRSALAEAGLEATPIDGLPQGLRIDGRAALETLAGFREGHFERQDAGSQRIVGFAAPRRGETVIDFCAGAGGKTLALASAMRNSGRVLAFDPSAARLERLRERCDRAGATRVTTYRINDETDPGLDRFRERGDLVLVDAPCSGTGTLRRDPALKWTLRPSDIADHAERQSKILAAASTLVAPGGRLVYATCSLLADENEAVMARFDRKAPPGRLQWAAPTPSVNEARIADASADPPTLHDVGPSGGPVVPDVGSGVSNEAVEAKWTPDRDKSDGFYAAKRAPTVSARYNSV